MRKSTFVKVGLTLLVLAGVVQAQPKPQPKIVLPAPRELGAVGSKEIRSFEFQITNEGDAPLHLKTIRPSCGCTMVTPPAMQIEAHQSIQVPLTFNAKGFAGAVHKSVEIESDDPVTPKATWVFTATVKRDYLFQPNGALVAATQGGAPATMEFRFIPLAKATPVKAVVLASEPDDKESLPRWLSYSWERKNGEVLVKVTLDPKKIRDDEIERVIDGGYMRCRVSIVPESGDPEDGTFVWTIRTTGVPPKSISSVVPTADQGTIEKNMRVVVAGPKPFKVLNVKSTNPGLTATVEAYGTDGKQFWVIPKAQGLKAGRYAETLTLVTDNSEFPTIRIKVFLILT